MFSLSRANLRVFGLSLLVAGLVQPALRAGTPGIPAAPGCCCPPPCAPCCVPCCQPPDICTCTTFKPVVETCYHQQPYTAYRDVCHTCYRKEPYCVTVPVTKVDCITCDEGCYKMVWCPKIVTKQIPRVEYHQQVCCRTVPYTVSQRVPYVATTIVPECRVHYCPETHSFLKPACPPPCCPCSCGAPCGCAAPGPGSPSSMPMTSQGVPPGEQAMAALPMTPQ